MSDTQTLEKELEELRIKNALLRTELSRERDYRLRAESRNDYYKYRLGSEHEAVWFWQGDGYDNLSSLVSSVNVVIRADDLRALVKMDDSALESTD